MARGDDKSLTRRKLLVATAAVGATALLPSATGN
jgi:hypothetical protein